MKIKEAFFLKKRFCVPRSSADKRPVLVFITYTGLGDLIMALPLFGMLRADFYVLPLIKSSDEDLTRLLCQDGVLEGYLIVDESLRFRRNPLGHLKLCFALSRLRPDVVVIYGKVLLGFAAYLGLLGANRTLFCLPWGCSPPTTGAFEVLAPSGNRTGDYLQFAKNLGVAFKATPVQLTDELKKGLRQALRPPMNWSSYAVVAPWAGDDRKAAPLQFFRECIEIIMKEGGLPVVITGMPQNRAQAATLLRGLPNGFVENLIGVTGISEMLGLLAGARFLLANDSGNLHLARLVGTPALVAFGPTTPEQLLLRDTLDGVVPLQLHLSCSPCHDSPRRYRCPGPYLQCLRGLAASEARGALLAACCLPKGDAMRHGSDSSTAVF